MNEQLDEKDLQDIKYSIRNKFVFNHKDGWYHFDEAYDTYGPYETEIEAIHRFNEYCRMLGE